MYSFKNDYSEGAHPNILNSLLKSNLVQEIGYGLDSHSVNAKELIKKAIGNEEAAVYFMSAGTQTNLIVISHVLRPYEAVISASSGHINTNETGAIESVGHRVISIDTPDGKLCVGDIENVIAGHGNVPHVVKPKMVYVSNPTELGTIYTKEELTALSQFCKEHSMFFYLDGARLGHALTAYGNDLSLEELSALMDIFYIGATKNGALLGEAVVFNNLELARDFDFSIKQKGALLAKGRLLGIQFEELFKDDLYFNLAKHANKMAAKITSEVTRLGYQFLASSPTNQLFPILPKSLIEKLSKKYDFYIWKDIDKDNAAIRLITSWNTDEDKVDEFISDLKKL